ncbi:DEAD/DEAH box helicase [Ferrimonas sp. SCSIO 43195]|uniref:DEAD/DEAH box helicase n=1 Tax=Ferrimonas sp. SCSIO 43195 TaxID=2822844 RepID=UPI0020758990|nr:AAA domain-containing protein [Ferrimonas sp. SCSIO 43195]USD36464.1 AAA family ATPase [Ferrimonas sp. SCSIO 43195]
MLAALTAIGVGVALTASAAAWYFDKATEEEQRRHSHLRADIDALNQQLAAHGIELETANALHLRQALEQVLTKLGEEHQRQRSKIAAIDAELSKLPPQLARELQDDSISPYRRRALKQSYCQIEDAQARLRAFGHYLDWYRTQLDHYWSTLDHNRHDIESLQTLLGDIELPSATLPHDWLYVGKVVLIEEQELDSNMAFNSRLHLTNNRVMQGWSSDFQERLFFDYPQRDAIPLQIVHHKTSAKGKRLFYGCVAKGRLWVDHILAGEPIPLEVERKTRLGYLLQSELGIVRANLPIQLTHNPLIELLPGQQVHAYADQYNLLLSDSPGNLNPKFKRIQVSMLDSAELGSEEQGGLFLFLDAKLLQPGWEAALDGADTTPWRMLALEGNQLVIARHNLRLHCHMDASLSALTVQHIDPYQDHGQGFELPLAMVAVDARLVGQTPTNPDAFEQLVNLTAQIAAADANQQQRLAQAKMLGQWQQVMDYQQSQLQLTVEGIASEPDEQAAQLQLSLQAAADAPLAEFIDACKQIQRSGFEPRCRLSYWGDDGQGQHRWLEPLPPRARHKLELVIQGKRLNLGLPWAHGRQLQHTLQQHPGSVALQLTLHKYDDALNRQHTALEAFRHDALASPQIKQILLAPGQYQGERDPFWHQHFSQPVQWQNPQLTPTQKQVIATALTERHLALIQGPPGTAKTTSIVEMLHQIFSQQPETRVLLVSQQHAAVDNALDRFIDLHQPQLGSGQVKLLRIGPEKKVEGQLRNYTLGKRQQEFVDLSRQAATQAAVSAQADDRALASHWLNGVLGPVTEEDEPAPALNQELTWLLLQNHNLVGATCVGLASRQQSIDQLRFDVVIIDEAGRSTVPELMIPMLRAKKVILIGDHFQLPPSVAPLLQTDEASEELPFLKETFLETSFFETLYDGLPAQSKSFLGEQFRMPKQIGDLVAELFYSPNGQRQLQNGRIIDESEFLLPHTLMWQDVRGRQQREDTSQYNREEASAIIRFLNAQRHKLKGEDTRQVAVITPYGAQKRTIRAMMAKVCDNESHGEYTWGGLSIRINTVDSFQGSEAELVCYSTVRTYGNLRFLLDWKRLNVACSRAKENLVFFGHLPFLRRPCRNGERNLFAEIIARIPKCAILPPQPQPQRPKARRPA